MNTADVNERTTAIDGHVIGMQKMYQIVIMSKGVERFRSLPMNEADTSIEMRRLIGLHTVVMGYRQDAGGAGVTLKKDNIRLEISKVEVKQS